MNRAIEKRQIVRINKEVTFLGFGALSIGRDWGIGFNNEIKRPSEEEAEKVLNAVLDIGINIIDTASAYHRSEERIGKFLNKRRTEYLLATKCGEHNDEPNTYYDFSYKAIKESIDRSLKLLRTDTIDLVQIHFGPNPGKVIDDGETLAAMKEAQKEGKIRYLGASIDGDLAKRLIESGDFDVMQMEYNLLNQKNKDNINLAKENGIGVLIRGGIARGLLSSKVLTLLDKDFPEKKKIIKLLDLVNGDENKLTSLALQFLYQEQGISSVLIGTKSLANLQGNIRLLNEEIDSQILTEAKKVYNLI